MAEDCEGGERERLSQSGIFTWSDKKIRENGTIHAYYIQDGRRKERPTAHAITSSLASRGAIVIPSSNPTDPFFFPIFPSAFQCNLSGGRYVVHNARLNGH